MFFSSIRDPFILSRMSCIWTSPVNARPRSGSPFKLSAAIRSNRIESSTFSVSNAPAGAERPRHKVKPRSALVFKNARENRVHLFCVIAEIEQLLEVIITEIFADFTVRFQKI